MPAIKLTATVCLLVLASYNASSALAQDSAVSGGTNDSGAITINGANMLMLSPRLRPGDVFDRETKETISSQALSAIHFHKVPSWLVGTWRISENGHFLLSPGVGADGKRSGLDPAAYVGFECGMVADKSGDVWTRDTVGKWSEAAGHSGSEDYGCFLRYEESKLGPAELRSHGETVTINTDSSGRIHSCVRGTTDQLNKNIGDEQIEIQKTSRSFDWQGKPKTSSQWKATYKRVAPFPSNKNVDRFSELAQTFVQFLKGHGLADRVPDELTIHTDSGVPN